LNSQYYLDIIESLPKGKIFTAYGLFGCNYYVACQLKKEVCLSSAKFENYGYTKYGYAQYRRKIN